MTSHISWCLKIESNVIDLFPDRVFGHEQNLGTQKLETQKLETQKLETQKLETQKLDTQPMQRPPPPPYQRASLYIVVLLHI